MKTIIIMFLFAAPLFAQDDSVAARAAAGCGSDQVNFDVKSDKKKHPAPQPEAGKALIYLFSEVTGNNYGFGVFGVTTRVGVDGAWVGANNNHSYFFVSVAPGDHRVCTNWQSSIASRTNLGKAVSLTAEAGRAYYFRIKVNSMPEGQHEVIMKLEQLDPAEGQLLIASTPLSSFQPKNK